VDTATQNTKMLTLTTLGSNILKFDILRCDMTKQTTKKAPLPVFRKTLSK